MKFNAYLRYDFTADLYRMEPNIDNPNGGLIPHFDKVVNLHFTNDPNSIRSIALTDEVLDTTNYSFTNIKDRNGFAAMGDTQYSITRITPVFNVWGNFECYQLTLAVSEYGMVERAD